MQAVREPGRVMLGGDELNVLTACEWWPREARINAGIPGHDREIVAVLEGYDWDAPIPEIVVDGVRTVLPASWMVENRGTRIEIHPTGRFAGGFTRENVAEVADALGKLRIVVADIEIRP